MKKVVTSVPVYADRNVPPKRVMEFASALEASGVVDNIQTFDQTCSWWPQAAWRPQHAPAAAFVPDCDSFAEAFVLGALALGATDRLGLSVSTDAIRTGPAELMQKMLTLAAAAPNGQVNLLLGAGELKQASPFGWRRSEGLDRLEDHFRLFNLLLECDAPFDFDGNHWKYRKAWVGSTRTNRPNLLAMGGGPRLMELATRFADGISTVVPEVFWSPEALEAEVKKLKRMVEQEGRDPATFMVDIWFPSLVHEDMGVIEDALDNPLIKYLTACMGRLNHADWEKIGEKSAMPAGWHYALKLLPTAMTYGEFLRIGEGVTPPMGKAAWLRGSPKQIAAEIQDYIDAGATNVAVHDFLPLVRPVDDATNSLQRNIEICTYIKESNPDSKDPTA